MGYSDLIWLILGYMWLFIHRPFEVWPWLAPYRIERVAMSALFLVWIFYPKKALPKNILVFVIFGFYLLILLAWVLSPFQLDGEKTVEDYSKVVLFCLILTTSVHREKDLKLLIWGFVGIMTLYMSHSYWEYLNGRHRFTMGTKRLYGIDSSMGHANSFSATIVFLLPLIRTLWRTARRQLTKLVLLGIGLLSVACIILTGSRSGFVGLLLFTLISIAMAQKRLWVLLAAAIIAPVVWVSMPEDRQNRFLTLVDEDRGPASAKASADGRLEGLVDGLDLLTKRPILGFGPGSFTAARGTGFNAHNLFGQIAGELGYIGIGAFLVILMCVVVNVRNARRFSKHHLPIEVGKFPQEVVYATAVTVILLLFLGWGAHSLYRYTWLWYLSFQAIAITCLSDTSPDLHDAAEEEDELAQPLASLEKS